MKARQQNFVLGIVVIAFLGLFLGTILFIYPALQYGTRPIVLHFRHEDGVAPLKPGSPVLLSGALEVGKVTDVRPENVMVRSEQGVHEQLMIVVEAEIQEEFELFEGCRITTNEPAVGGSGFVVILNVGTPGRPLDPTRPIEGLPPESLSATISNLSRRLLTPGGMVDQLEEMVDKDAEGSLMNKVVASLEDVNAMTRALRNEMNPREQATVMRKIHGIMDDLNATTAALREQASTTDQTSALVKVHAALDRLGEGLSEATAMLRENRPAVRNTLASIERVSQAVDEDMLAALRTELKRDDPSSLVGKLHVSMDHLNASLANVETVSEEGRKLVVLNRPTIERTIANVKELSEQAKLTIQSIYLAPWRLLNPPGLGEKRQTGVFEAARTFAEAATYLDDAAARLEAAVAASADGQPLVESDKEIQAIQQSLKAAFERFERAEQFLWEKMK